MPRDRLYRHESTGHSLYPLRITLEDEPTAMDRLRPWLTRAWIVGFVFACGVWFGRMGL